MAKKGTKGKPSGPPEIRNNRARHHFHIGERLEAGLQLTGTEVKSIRAGKAQLTEAFCRIGTDNVPMLYHAYIDEYSHGTDANHNPTRPRRLLLNKKQIRKLRQELEAGGQALIPLRLYFKQALIKCEIALAKGKKLHDKREDLKRKTQEREARRAVDFRRR